MPLTKAQAKSLDILEVARSLGMEMKRKSHREYYWTEHDSFKIDTVKNTWHWYSQNLFGDTINLVQQMQNVSYKEAMVFLETGSFPEAKPVEEERKPFNYTLAPYEQPFVEARTYLKEIRGLSDDTIDFFLEKGVLAQAKRKDKEGVIEDVLVFKYLDRNQQLVGASLQGLVPDQERHPGKGYLKQIMYQSESISGLNVSIGSPKRLIVTEAPIDLMSYYELHKGELNDVRLVAMEGLKEGVLSHYVLEILQNRGEIAMDERDYTKSSELTRTSKFLSVAAETSTLFQDHKYDDLITLAVDRDKAGTDFITKLREKKIPTIDARPPQREGQEKTDWNEILKQEKQLEKTEEIQSSSHFPDTSHLSPEDAAWLKENWNNIDFSVEPRKQMVIDSDKTVTYEKLSNPLGDGREPKKQIQSTEKAPESSQEQMNDRASGGEGYSQHDAVGSAEPEAELSATFEQTVASHPTSPYRYLHFSTTFEEVQRRQSKYHPITSDDLKRMNQYAGSIQKSSQWYLEELANSKIYYFYSNNGEVSLLDVNFKRENFLHLTGIRPVVPGRNAGDFVVDFAEGRGDYNQILVSNSLKEKLQVIPMLEDILDPKSFVLDNLDEVRIAQRLNFSEAIKSKDEDFLLLFKDIGEERVPASLMKINRDLKVDVEKTKEKVILAVFRERDGNIEQLSINEDYVKDRGNELQTILKDGLFEEIKPDTTKEIEQSTPENTLNSLLLDSATFTQVLDTVYNLGVPGDISKTPEEFHQAWNQYLDYAKQHNDNFDQIVAAAGADHLLDTNSDFYKEWQQDHIYKENYHVRLQWAEERPDGPKLPFKETELISYQDFARELYKANQSFYPLHQEGLKQVTDGRPEGYISPTKIQFSIYAPDGELIQDGIRYDIGNEINPIAHKERLGTREMREYPELMKIDGAIFTPYHLERLASELDISQFSYALEDTLYADQLLSQLPFGDLENSPIGFTDSSHDGRLGFISFDGMDSVEVENLSAWFEKLGVKDSPMEQLALIEKWQKEIKGLSEKVEQTISTVREEFEKSQEEEIKLEEQGYNKQELEHDADADGVSDEEELLQGTNPYDFRSKPGSKPEGEESLQADEVVLAAGSLAVADFIQNKDMAGLSRHLKEGIKEFLDSDKYKDYLTKMSQLNNYSNRNLRLILAQNPEARQVASFKQWKENFDRYVKKGEKALRIFKPMTKIKKDENNQPILDKNGKPETVTFFGLVPVFDVSQTEGKEMPKAAEVKEQLTDLDYANLYRALMAIAKENDVSVRFEEMENNKHGYYSVPENQIVLRSNEMNKAQIIKTFLHEMAHAELHHADNPQKENLTRSTAELQAESVAYVVSSYYGIDTSEYSFNYLSGWSADKETLADLEAQLDIVQQEAKSLMVRMDQALEQLRLSQEKQTKRSFEQKLEKFQDQSKQAVEDHKQELKADAQSKKEKGFSK
ncbi:PBECR4 domain-containing protein [uncultured Streptococcus sp.]|uniref:PBECR4 domain-containing protein n=1 Tax=Streptococcus oralis TaxID=1303 RepID=UPI001C1EF528|nr:PBECR4 domain-containing protein [uncultured Streptococcus sp.]MBU6862489.1 toprim domain-containing protein [Streptococcus oralis]